MKWTLPESIHTFRFSPITTAFITKELKHLPKKSKLDIFDLDTKLLGKGSNNEPSIYRPISVLSHITKLAEKAVI